MPADASFAVGVSFEPVRYSGRVLHLRRHARGHRLVSQACPAQCAGRSCRHGGAEALRARRIRWPRVAGPSPCPRVAAAGEPLPAAHRLRGAGQPFRAERHPQLAAAAAAAKLVGRRDPARHRVRDVDLSRQHCRRDHRRGHGKARLSRPGRNRVPRRHRRGVERRRCGQRDRRHDHHDDVDQRRFAVGRRQLLSWPPSPPSPSSRRSPRCSSSASRRSRRQGRSTSRSTGRAVSSCCCCCCRSWPSTSLAAGGRAR